MPQEFISVSEASDFVGQAAQHFTRSIEKVPFTQSLGRILAEDIIADRAFPPFDRVAMDGVALNWSDWQEGLRNFRNVGIQAAGAPTQVAGGLTTCMEVMTGAVLPKGYDVVVPYEYLKLNEDEVVAEDYDASLGKNIHKEGSDRRKGDVILHAGKRMGAADLGVIATVGKSLVSVYCDVKATIISTGDELVSVDSIPEAHQIRRSNVHSLQALLSPFTKDLNNVHLPDSREELRSGLADLLRGREVLILSGGVSMGKFDFVPEVLRELEVDVKFYKVRQRPGKPFWFGVHTSGTVVFALPGNPVSSFMCMVQYVLPFFQVLDKQEPVESYAVLAEELRFAKPMTYFLQVKTRSDRDGRTIASPVRGKGSGDLAGLTDADGFIVLPAEQEVFAAGEVFPFLPFGK